MSPSPELAKQAAHTELSPCAICGRPKFFHYQSAAERRFQDFRDDGHMFRRTLSGQAKLPFGEAQPAQQNAIQTQRGQAQKKKPPQKVSMQKAGQKKPLQRGTKKATKPGKRSVA